MSRDRDAGYWDDLISEYGSEAVNRSGAYQPDEEPQPALPVAYFRDAADEEDDIP